jgi:hypothetical protein
MQRQKVGDDFVSSSHRQARFIETFPVEEHPHHHCREKSRRTAQRSVLVFVRTRRQKVDRDVVGWSHRHLDIDTPRHSCAIETTGARAAAQVIAGGCRPR